MTKRLFKELANREYDILEYSIYHCSITFEVPKIIRVWKNRKYYIDFNVHEYPFKRPFIIGSNLFHLSHETYDDAIKRFNLNDFTNHISNKKNFDFCLYCNSILSCDFDWTPRYMLYHIVKQVEQINCLLSSAIKLNMIKNNYTFIPEDVISYIFSFLTPNIDDILNIKIDNVMTLKIL